MIKFEAFENIFNKIEGEPEFTVYFNNRNFKYMIIKYDGYLTFQRCGIEDGSGEIRFNNLKELYETKTIDDICLKDEWNNIKDIIIDEYISVNEYEL